MENNNLKETIKERFDTLYGESGMRILAVQLDGFSHRLIYDYGFSDDEILSASYSAYTTMDGLDRIDELFSGISHYTYKHNATELIYLLPNER